MNRRKFIGIGAGVVATALVLPSQLSAVDFRKKDAKAFADKDIKSALKDLYGTDTTIKGGVSISAPDIAENGAVVPITVSTDKANVKSIAVFIEGNPEVLAAVFNVPATGIPKYALRVKMKKTGHIIVVANVDGKLYTNKKLVKVTIGGCGG